MAIPTPSPLQADDRADQQPQQALQQAPATPVAATMQAIVQAAYGIAAEDVLRLEDVARPVIAADQILVRVRAASVDRGTWHMMAGLPYPVRLAGFGVRAPKATNPGRSFAGVVESAGKRNVTGVQAGAMRSTARATAPSCPVRKHPGRQDRASSRQT